MNMHERSTNKVNYLFELSQEIIKIIYCLKQDISSVREMTDENREMSVYIYKNTISPSYLRKHEAILSIYLILKCTMTLKGQNHYLCD